MTRQKFLNSDGVSTLWEAIKSIVSGINTRIDNLEELANNVISTTYSELKTLRDNSQLIPGQQYRITDYQTISNQENTDADGRRFDIIVTADNEYTLNENARAVHHEECDDFKDENLDAWEIKYTIDNSIYHWGNGGDRIESETEEFYSEYDIVSINEDKIEYGYDDEIWGEFIVDKSQTYNINGNEYYGIVHNSRYYVPVNYSVDDYVYWYDIYYSIDPSFITNKTFIFDGNTYYQLDRYDYYVLSEYHNDLSIYEYNYEFWDDYNILSINGDKIEYGYDGEDPYGEYTINKSKTYNIQGAEYYRTIEAEYYYVPVNYSVGDYIYYYDAYMYNYETITNIVNFPSGTGTIYYMKDEYNNECSYDFKCIRFLKGTEYVYTFDESCTNNIIKPDYKNSIYYALNCITFGNNCNNNSFGNNCYNNTFGSYCCNNTFGNNCYNNTFGNTCNNNSFGNNCYHNMFESASIYNSFGVYCFRNTFKSAEYNTFGNYCQNNTSGHTFRYNSFGNGCHYNSFGNACISNSFTNLCQYNLFGNYCSDNSFGNNCQHNSLGNNCGSNSFGNNCQHNSLGNNCGSNSFGNRCQYNSFRLSTSYTGTLLDNCYYNHFDDGCIYNIVYSSAQVTGTNFIKNYNINRGVRGTTKDEPLIIEAKYLNSENVCNVYKKGNVAVVAYIQY